MMQFDEKKTPIPGMRCWVSIVFDKKNAYRFVITYENGETLSGVDKQKWTGYTCSYRMNRSQTKHFGGVLTSFDRAVNECIAKLEELRN